jgi:hypothetical protein
MQVGQSLLLGIRKALLENSYVDHFDNDFPTDISIINSNIYIKTESNFAVMMAWFWVFGNKI